MDPPKEMVSIPVEAKLDEVLHTMIEHQHSRLPVYSGRPEQIVGILFYKDLLPVWASRRARDFRIERVMRKHMVVPETKPLVQMVEEVRNGKSHMAVVGGEFSTIVGLLTFE